MVLSRLCHQRKCLILQECTVATVLTTIPLLTIRAFLLASSPVSQREQRSVVHDPCGRTGGTMKQKKRVALYDRVSTADQSVTMQQMDLRRYAKARGLALYKEYCDEGVSETKAKRPALDRLMDDARKRRFDVVGVWRFDRFARSTKHLFTALEQFQHLSIDFVSW